MGCVRRRIGRAFFFLAVSALLASCATLPPMERGAADYLGMLPPGRTAYLSLDLTRTRDLVPLFAQGLGLKARDLSGPAERVSAVYAGVFLDPAKGPVFAAILPGNFPPACVRTGLGLRGARRVREKGEVWQEDKGSGTQIAVVERGVLLASNGGIREAIAAYRSPEAAGLPAEIASLATEADIVVFFPQVPDGSGALGVPAPATAALLELWASADRIGDPGPSGSAESVTLDISLGFRLSGEREARLFRPVLKLLLLGLERQGKLPGGTEALAGIKDEVEGNVVRLHGLRLTVGQAVEAVGGLLGFSAVAEGAK